MCSLTQLRATGADRLQAGLAADDTVRWVTADVAGAAEEARQRLDLSPMAAGALGRCLAAAAMLQRLASKTPSRLVIQAVGDGPLGQVQAEVDDQGNLRGLVGEPRATAGDPESPELPVGEALGAGTLRVLREIGGRTYRSEVELAAGEIGQGLTHYLHQSEQRRSAVLLGALARPWGLAAAGGVIVEVTPGVEEATVERVEANLASVSGVSRILERRGTNGLLAGLLDGLGHRLLEERELQFHCGCTRERLQGHLELLTSGQRDEVRDEAGRFLAECAFCGDRFEFTVEELGPPGASSDPAE